MAKIKLNKILQNNFSNLAKKVAFIVILTVLVSGFVYFADHNFNFAPASLAGAGHNLSGYAWSETIGWISFNNTTGGGSVNYGVNIDPATGDLSGYAWSENIGWIKFDPIGPYPSLPNNSAKLDTTTNQITGWARACAGTVSGDCTGASRTDGWDGWIKMSGIALNGSGYGVTRSSGANCGLSGYAWGSDVVGWISFKGIAGNGSPYGVSSAFCESPAIVDLKINGSDGPLNLNKGQMKNITWTTTNAASCTASSSDVWSGSKAIPSGSESLTANVTSNHTLNCIGLGGDGSDSVMVNVSCVPINNGFGECDCTTETRRETGEGADCLPWTGLPVACTSSEKNACRDFNYREVAP